MSAPAHLQALDRAERLGFVHVPAGHDHQVTGMWWQRCRERDCPYIVVVAGRRWATVVVDLLTRGDTLAFTSPALVLLLDTARRLCPWGRNGVLHYTSQHLTFERIDREDAVVLAMELVTTLQDPNLYEPYRPGAPVLAAEKGTEWSKT